MSEEVKCPYCEKYIIINTDEHNEGYEVYECPKCNKNFEVFAEPTIDYTVGDKAECLNGGEHQWKQRIGYPQWYFTGKYLCRNCSARKTIKEEQLTEEEYNV